MSDDIQLFDPNLSYENFPADDPRYSLTVQNFDPELVRAFFDGIDLKTYPQLRRLAEYHREHFGDNANQREQDD